MTVKDIVKALLDASWRFSNNEGWLLSGYIAYTSLLAMFPFLLFAASMATLTIGPDDIHALIDLLFEYVPRDIAVFIEPELHGVLTRASGTTLSITLIGALYVASSGVDAFRTAFDRAYGGYEQSNWYWRRFISILFVLVGGVVFPALGLLVVFAPTFLLIAERVLETDLPNSIGTMRYLLSAILLAATLYLFHYVLPARSKKGLMLWPGILATALLWFGAAVCFSIYLTYMPSYTITYGSLAGVIITLLFFYISGAVIIFGAEVNAAIDRKRLEVKRRLAAPYDGL